MSEVTHRGPVHHVLLTRLEDDHAMASIDHPSECPANHPCDPDAGADPRSWCDLLTYLHEVGQDEVRALPDGAYAVSVWHGHDGYPGSPREYDVGLTIEPAPTGLAARAQISELLDELAALAVDRADAGLGFAVTALRAVHDLFPEGDEPVMRGTPEYRARVAIHNAIVQTINTYGRAPGADRVAAELPAA